MKKIILAFAIIVFGIACNSGKEKKEENRAAKIIAKMTTVCQLTPDQASKVQPILETFIKTKVDNKDKYASDQEALRKADSVNRRHYMDTLKTILSPDQIEKLKTLKMQKPNQQKGGEQDNE